MKIAFVYAGGRLARLGAVRAGRAPTEFFYGGIEIGRRHGAAFFDAPENARSALATAYNLALGGVTPARTRGEHVLAVAPLLRKLRGFHVVVGTSTSLALALALWRRLGRFNARVVGIHCGLVNFPLSAARVRTTRWALRGQDCALFAGPERDEMVARFGLPEDAVHVNPFGVDTDFWTPGGAGDGEFLLSVGNDARRDYATLIEAVKTMTEIPVKIITARKLPNPLPAHVEHLDGSWHRPAVSDEELRDLYRRAIAVVIPLEDSIQPSGQSVALQAMACGKPVILSRTRGLWTGDDYENNRDLVLVEAGSPDALATALRGVCGDAALRDRLGAAARRAVVARGAIGDFAGRLEAVCART